MTDRAEPLRPDVPGWVQDAIVYQVFPDRFARSGRVASPGTLEAWDAPPTINGFKGGDLLGIVDRLDHLASLSVDTLYLNPIFQSASNHRYHTYDYLTVDPLLGGNDALRTLLDACHGRGMRVILDGVFNHTGRGFWPFHHLLETGIDSPYRDWFVLSGDVRSGRRGLDAYPLGVVATLPDEPLGSGRHSLAALGYQAWWDLPALPKLNMDHPAVRDHLLEVAETWIRFGIDGWRLDVPEEVATWFWREFRRRVRAVNPDAWLVAEIWWERPEAVAGDTFDATMNYPLGAAILSFVGAGRLDRRVLAQQSTLDATIHDLDGGAFLDRVDHLMALYPPEVSANQLTILGSHDTPRLRTMLGGDAPAARLAMLLELTLPGAPSIYYGDELGLEGEHDPGCRAGMPWDAPERWDRGLLAMVRAAAALRRAEPVLRRGEYRRLAGDGAAIAFQRRLGGDVAIVAVNRGAGPASLVVDAPELVGRELRTALRASAPEPDRAPGAGTPELSAEGRLTIELGPQDGVILLSGGG
jgi:cyclomaltodextrinase / maltogenic alpha-amylase / neopullulanase